MNKDETWKLFMKTGSILAYLHYKELCKEEYAHELTKDKNSKNQNFK